MSSEKVKPGIHKYEDVVNVDVTGGNCEILCDLSVGIQSGTSIVVIRHRDIQNQRVGRKTVVF
jgi:hypothetical protein